MSAVRLTDGSASFDGGVDAGRVTTVVSERNPQGLQRNQLAWGTNITVRGGGISPRSGWTALTQIIKSLGLYQGGQRYQPIFGDPYLICQISGRIYQIRVDTNNAVVDLSAANGDLTNPPQVPQVFMEQGQQFLVIQAGDYSQSNPTLPLFWDGVTLRRSKGITTLTPTPGTHGLNELPAGGAMKYYQGRLWYVQGNVPLTNNTASIGNTTAAGDIVGGQSGTAQYNFTDSILNVTENPLSFGGDGISVPSNSGPITALDYTTNLDTTLGQGPLYIFTKRQVYQLTVPVSRADWIAATSSNPPIVTVAQIKYGSVSDRCVTHVNGDLFYKTPLPGINSLYIATRFFQQWANVPISRPINRALQYENLALSQFSTGIEFDNRLLQGILPIQTPAGPAFQAVAVLDFDIIPPFGSEAFVSPPVRPAWEGMLEGLDVLQLFEGTFASGQRAFAFVHNRADSTVWLWELTNYLIDDEAEIIQVLTGLQNNRIQWYVELPSYDFETFFDLKDLDGAEIYVDKVNGQVDMIVDYRVDADPCWQFWKNFSFCANASNPNVPSNPSAYPQVFNCEGQKFPLVLPKPPLSPGVTMNARPNTRGYQFQIRIRVKGACRIRGLAVFALPVDRQPYEGLNTPAVIPLPTPPAPPPPPPAVTFLVANGAPPPSLFPATPIFLLDNTSLTAPSLWSFDGAVWVLLFGNSNPAASSVVGSPFGLLVGQGTPLGFIPEGSTLWLDNTDQVNPNLWSYDGSVWSELVGDLTGAFNGFTKGTGQPLVFKGSPILLGLFPKLPTMGLDNTVPTEPNLWSWDGLTWAQLTG